MSDRFHDHTFGQELKKPGENRTWIVIAITGVTMIVEIIAGLAFGSMALLADGLHMASHAVALAINAIAYWYARRHAADERFSFGTGKVNALGGFTGAILLGGFAAVMAYESVERIFQPVQIQFLNAVAVAVVGLAVNGVSVFILGDHHDHGQGHSHDHDHAHDHGHDHNLRSAYFHVLADALTSFTAIFALLAARYFGAVWLDPVMGIVGSILVANWSIRLLKETSRVLLDRQVDQEMKRRIVDSIQRSGVDRVTDLHLWSIGPDIYNLNVSIESDAPKTPDVYKALLPEEAHIVHSTVEVHPSKGSSGDRV